MNKIEFGAALGISGDQVVRLSSKYDGFPSGAWFWVTRKKSYRIWMAADIPAAQKVVNALRAEGFL